MNGSTRTIGDPVQTLRARFDALPEKVRFIIVGGFGVLIGWLIYNTIYLLNPIDDYRATSSWLIGYLIGISQQHGMHWAFTFQGNRRHYGSSLRRAYIAYSGALVLSTVINYIMVEIQGFHYQLAWVVSVGASVVMNYTLLRKFSFDMELEDTTPSKD